MLPVPAPVINGVRLSHEELRGIHSECRRALDDATATLTIDSKPLPVPWRTEGWRYQITALGRDEQNALLIRITVRSACLPSPFVRRVRMIKRKHLPRNVSQGVARGSGHPHT